MNDTDWMRRAVELALQAQAVGEVPVGAVLVSDTQQQIGCGHNEMIRTHDATAHAEICAIRMAGKQLQNYRLDNTTLYVTLEPCIMCVGAILHSRIKRVVFGARDLKTGAAGSVCNLFHQKGLYHSPIQIDEGVLQAECSSLLVNFFKQKR